MTAAPTAEPVGVRGRTPTRHPVQVDLDGDFALGDLLALPDTGPAHRITATQATLATLWRLNPAVPAEPAASSQPGATTVPHTQTDADVALLHRTETGGLFRPPVHGQVAALTPELGAAWLALAAHWIDLSRSSGDLRFLNTACKLTGAVWIHHNGAAGVWGGPGLTAHLAAVGRLLGEATDLLRSRLANRILLAEPAKPGDEELRPARLTGTVRARTVVLAAAGSRSAGRLVTATTAAGLPIETVCWYTAAPHGGPAVSSNYSSMWYPPTPPAPSPTPGVPNGVPVTSAESWDDVAAAIRAADADIVLLVGMPVIPARVLGAAKLGVLNAHNGALPSHRGMDAVGWALLHNQPIVCSLHLARPAVDAGEVLAAHPVPVAPTRTLAARVKATQLRLLLAGAAHVAATGALPDSTPQPAAGTQFYRLHPHLKRLLDASPYAHDNQPQRVIQL
ncbi:MAG: formyltransferase family protein [Pseudonocardiaceae bacterium]